MKYLIVGLILALCQVQINAHSLISSKVDQIMDACNQQTRDTATYCDEKEEYDCPCINQNYMATMMGCALSYNTSLDAFKEALVDLCNQYYTPMTNRTLLDGALTLYDEFAVETSSIPNFNKSEIINVPVKIDESSRIVYASSYFKYYNNSNRSIYYGASILGYWAFILLASMVVNWSKVLFPRLVFQFSGPISNKWRKHFSLPAVYRKHKNQSINFGKVHFALIPSRLETTVIAGFVILSIAFNADITSYQPGDKIFENKLNALSRYVADRSGITATFMIPLLILFAGRNNFLCFVTRIHYNTFITYHKWVARITTILVVIHSITFTIICVNYSYSYYLQYAYFYWGIIATVMMCCLCGQAFLHLRRTWYEIFLMIHILFAVFFVIGGWYHLVDMGYVEFMYAAIAVWAFDRLVRILRLLWFGVARAKVTLLADETLRIVIPKPKRWKSIPGGYAFIHFLRPSCFWQSHPFTFTELPGKSDEIILYCKVKGGVTHGLYQYLATMPECTATVKVTLEGPYGEAAPVRRHDTAVFIAGGNGIPGLYSEITDLLVRCKNTKQAIKLYWVIREYRSLIWFHEELMAIKNSKVQTTIFVTKPASTEYLKELNNIVGEKEESKKLESSQFDDSESINDEISFNSIKRNLEHITFKIGRPDINQIVASEIEESAGPIAFVTCGHLMMVDDVRQAVVDNIDKGKGKRVDFFEQLETWA